MSQTDDAAGRTGAVILVVDDDEYVHVAVSAALRSSGAVVVRAGTAAEALVAAHDHHPDLAIVDLGLPDSDGYTLVTALRSDPATAGMRIVILTGHLPDEQAAKAAGADAIMGKPFRLHEFLEMVALLLGPRPVSR